MPSKHFVFTFSVDEWKQIQPHEIQYKAIEKSKPRKNSRFLYAFLLNFNFKMNALIVYFRIYYVLPKFNWSPILAEHFWEHTKLPCCLSFKRAKVYPDGNNYVVVVARCTVCRSHFKGTINERPMENSRLYVVINIF